MIRSARPIRLFAGLLVAMATIAIWASGASAQDAGSITINVFACEGDDCSAPAAGVAFNASAMKLDYSADGVTDDAGVVVLPLPEENSIGSEITVTSVPPVNVPVGGEIPFAFDCTKNGGEAVESRYSQVQTDPGGDVYTAAITAADGDAISCNWYLSSADSGADTPPVSELPNTGSGIAQHSPESGGISLFLAMIALVTAGYATVQLARVRR